MRDADIYREKKMDGLLLEKSSSGFYFSHFPNSVTHIVVCFPEVLWSLI